MSRPTLVTVTGSLTGSAASTLLQLQCGGGAIENQSGTGPVDRTFSVPTGGFCAINVQSYAESFLVPDLTPRSEQAGFNLSVTVH